MVAQLGLDSILLQLGVGGIFAILVIRMVLDFLNRRNGGSGNTKVFDKRMVRVESNVDEIKDCVHKIHDMHNVKNSDGIPVWYIPQSWANTQKEIQETNLKTLEILKDLTKTMGRLEGAVSNINKELH